MPITGVAPRQLVEAVERERHAGATGEREQVDDRVRAAAERHQQRDRVVERRRGEDLRRREPLARERDGAASRSARLRACGPRRRPGSWTSRAGTCRAPRRGPSSSTRCRARCSARTTASPRPRARRTPPSTSGPRAARRRSARGRCRRRARGRGSRPACDGPAGDHDRRHAGAGRAHQLRGHRLVAAAEQDDRVERVRADALLDVHRHEVAVEHRASASSGSRRARSSGTRAAARPPAARRAWPPRRARGSAGCS